MLTRRFAHVLAPFLLVAAVAPPALATNESPTSQPPVKWPAGHSAPNYDKEAPADMGAPKIGCGYMEYTLTQEKLVGGWGDYASSVGGEVPSSCKFPKQGKRWAKLQGLARKQAAHWSTPEAGDVVIVPNDASWEPLSSSNGVVLRGITFLVYRKKLQIGNEKTECGESDRKVVCEASGSKGALVLNASRFNLQVAKEAVSRKDMPDCESAAKAAVAWTRGLAKFRSEQKAAKDWTEGLTYKTRYDGRLSEAKLFEKVAALQAEGEKIWKSCGATSLAIDDYYLDSFKTW